MTIRRQRLADVAAVSQVRARSWRAAYDGIVPAAFLDSFEPTPESIARDEERFLGRGGQVYSFVALLDEILVGFVVAGPDRDLGPPAGEVWAIYVDPAYWGSGIGNRLLGKALGALRDADRDPIALWVLEENRPARSFYEHAGFVPTGERRHIDLGVPLPEIKYLLQDRPPQTG
jgi:ribosomal protein S18 acetylase RimI-like enzyme